MDQNNIKTKEDGIQKLFNDMLMWVEDEYNKDLFTERFNNIQKEAPSSKTLLCIEESEIDRIMLKLENELSDCNTNEESKPIQYALNQFYELKSKMKPVSKIKEEAWNKGAESSALHARCKDDNENDVSLNIDFIDKNIQQDKNKYLNGE